MDVDLLCLLPGSASDDHVPLQKPENDHHPVESTG